ncbi:MAG: sodium:proton exchanger [Planctomycetota bacterium]|nr:MAG: sodium:proton exchanger [Planctomycetota bacterium]
MQMIADHPFYEMAAILALATLVGGIGYLLKQPLIIAFLAVGVLAGPAVLGLIDSYERIELLADIGIALLLFIVGMRLDLHLIKTMGPVALATGLGQVTFTALIGYVIAILLGFDALPAAFIAVALTFSSTIIIVKLLSDKREIDALHGRIAVGMLIVQDIVAIVAMVALIALSKGAGAEEVGHDPSIAWQAVTILGKGVLFIGAIVIMMRWVLPRLLEALSNYQELMVLFAITWAVALAATGDMLGFSKEVGAFMGGVALASTGYREALGARLTTLRDFLLLFFFIALGARLEFAAIVTQIPAALVFSAFVLIGNPLIVMIIMGIMGYRRRTGLLTGLTVAQISEFSLILAALGMSLGHISNEAMSLITVVGVFTICASTYMILYSAPLYGLLGNWITWFERKNPYREQHDGDVTTQGADTMLIGLGAYGGNLAEHLIERGHRLVGVDFDPEALRRWRSHMGVVYGDATDPEFLDQLEFSGVAWIVSTTRDRNVSLNLIEVLRRRGYAGRIALTARNRNDAEIFAKAGADVVLRPFRDAAEQGADALHSAMLCYLWKLIGL